MKRSDFKTESAWLRYMEYLYHTDAAVRRAIDDSMARVVKP